MLSLGDRAKDVITGQTGIVVALRTRLSGRERVGLQPEKVGKDGKLPETIWLDAAQAVLVKKAVVKGAPAEFTGGPARGEETK